MYKELFKINYNNKKFLILSNNHRMTFLEIDSNNSLIYPDIEDFINLHNIYNNKNYFIYYRTLNYEEKARLKSALLGITTAASIFLGTTFVLSNNIPKKNYHDTYYYSIEYNRLNEMYTDTITRDDVITVINSNPNLNDYYKELAIRVLDNLISLDKDINLRIYYENMKDLVINKITVDEITKDNTMNVGGYYNSSENAIYVSDDNEFTLMHEISHTAHVISNGDIMIYEKDASFIAEALTNIVALYDSDSNSSSYVTEGLVVNFFLENVDNYNFHTYNTQGVYPLIQELKDKYKDVDIDYLIDFFEANKDSNIYLNQHINLNEQIEVLDELFKISIENIDSNNLYASFKSFEKLIRDDGDLFYRYYFKYINTLIEKGYITNQEFDILNSNYITLNNNELSISNNYNSDYTYAINKNLKDSICEYVLSNDNDLNDINLFTINYMINTASFLNSLSSLDSTTIELLLDNIFEITILNNDLDSAKEIYENSFSRIFSYANNDTLVLKYKTKYEEFLLSFSNNIEAFNNVSGLVLYNDNYYPIIYINVNDNTDMTFNNGVGIRIIDTKDNSVTIEYIDKDMNTRTITINNGNVNYYKFLSRSLLLNYMLHNPTDNYDDEYFKSFLETIEIDESVKSVH